jgi:hypothetical protein
MGSISLARTTDGTTSNANSNLNNNWTTIENLVNGAIDASNLAADSVGSSEIAANAVTTAEILDAAVTLAKLAASSVDNSKVAAAAAIAVTKLANGADGQVLKTVGTTPTWSGGVGSVQRNAVSVDTPENTSENDLQTITLSANALAVGDAVRIWAAGTESGTTGLKTMNLYFGGTLIASQNRSSPAADWLLMADLIVTGASAQKAIGLGFHEEFGATNIDKSYTSPTATISGSIIVKTTGTTANATDEIVSEILVVQIFKA